MTSDIHCPQCKAPVDPQARYCEYCGVDLALAAVMEESDVRTTPEANSKTPIAPEMLVPRLGEFMIENGIIESQDLQYALDYQAKKAATNNPVLLGQALLELDLVDRETLDQVITRQILQLQSVLSESNRRLEKRVRERTLDLQRALERLAELNQLKSNFLDTISHELRTPLTHMKGYLDIFVDGGFGPLNPQQLEAIHVLQQAEESLEHRVEDLIQFSLAAQGELRLDLRHVHLNELIEGVVDEIRRNSNARHISLKTSLAPQLPLVRADKEKMGWVVKQLLDNAVKFTPEGGEVAVTTLLEKDSVLVSVVDNGIGIPGDRLLEIFEPFHQLDGSTARKYSGIGLGLALVRRVVEAHGSHIEVQSTVGRGSRFEFRLPYAAANGTDRDVSGEKNSLKQKAW